MGEVDKHGRLHSISWHLLLHPRLRAPSVAMEGTCLLAIPLCPATAFRLVFMFVLHGNGWLNTTQLLNDVLNSKTFLITNADNISLM